MKSAKIGRSMTGALAILGVILYLFMHVYFAIIAFTQFKLWFALLVFLAPVVGDLLLMGASIGMHNWIPAIIFSVVAFVVLLAEIIEKRAG